MTSWIMLGAQILCTVITGCVGFLLKKEFNKAETAMRKVSELETKMAEEYVRKDDYNITNGEILRQLRKIEDMVLKIYEQGGMK